MGKESLEKELGELVNVLKKNTKAPLKHAEDIGALKEKNAYYDKEIDLLREEKHKHGNHLSKHDNQIDILLSDFTSIKNNIEKISTAMQELTKYKWIGLTIVCIAVLISSGNFTYLVQLLKGG